MKQELFNAIRETIASLDVNKISDQRKKILDPLATYIRSKIEKKEPIALNFICTHNSRRSHLSQVWAQTLAYHLGIENIDCYSGGTEATALFPMVAETIENSGFLVKILSDSDNPIYSIKYAPNAPAIIGFSKTYDNDFNPKANFAAIMTCSSADGECPFVAGAEERFAITYEDPKVFDNTSQQKEKYRERSLQIAMELFYVMKKSIAQD